MKREPLLAVVGPTGVGKSDLGVLLAEMLGGEVVSADSMQVYRGLDIGTGKITPAQRRGIPHHLLDVVEPEEPFSAAEFERLALAAVAEIRGRGRLPVVVGGTGLYYRVLIRRYLFEGPGADPDLRAELSAEASEKGSEALHRRLAEVDPAAAARIHPRDLRRIIRALEVYTLTGVPLSSQQQGEAQPRFNLVSVGLTAPREILYQRIEARVDRMLAEGLVDEVRRLKERGLESWLTAVQALGYKEFFPYLAGGEGLAAAVDLLKQDTRRFAKRQLTWFRREPEVRWVDRTEFPTAEALAERIVRWTEGVW